MEKKGKSGKEGGLLKKAGKKPNKTRKWEERREIKSLIARVKSGQGQELAKEKQISECWERYTKGVRPGIQATDRLQAESIAKAFVKVVRR
jgi:hypothetical protein